MGVPLDQPDDEMPLQDVVSKIFDQLGDGVVNTGTLCDGRKWDDSNESYNLCYSTMFWNPRATKIDNTYVNSYDEEEGGLIQAMPTIDPDEATLLCDLLSQIFVYEPEKRIKAEQILQHPWFRFDSTP